MAQNLRRIEALVFDNDIANNWLKFRREWDVYSKAGLSDKSKKVQAYTFLNLAGSDALDKYESFHFHEGEDKEDPEVLIKKFDDICLPERNVIMDRHAFNMMAQKSDEGIQSYVATLRLLAKRCDFGALTDELIRDRIVCGIHNDAVRAQLLREKDLTLDSAIRTCMLFERSDKATKELKKETEVFAVQQREHHCGNCGGEHGTERNKCPAFNKRCNLCNKWNHFAKCCRSKPPITGAWTSPFRANKKKYVHRINEVESDDSRDGFHCESVDLFANRGEIFTTLSTTCNTQVKLKIDTGAKCNVMSLSALQSIDPRAKIDQSTKVNLIAYGGQTIPTLGTTTLNLSGDTLLFHIVDRNVKSLLGLPDSIRLNLIQLSSEVHAVQQQASEMTDYEDLFRTDTIGKLPVTYHMRLDESVHPTVCAPRRIPLAMKDKVVAELDRMIRLGIIAPVEEATPWVSAMAAAVKKDGTVRICIDPVHLNKALLRPYHPLKTVEQVIADMPQARVFSILDAKCGFWQIPLDEESSTLTTFMTPFGRYKFLRMPYGISTGSEVFQRCMEQLFAGHPCEIVVDDILIWGSSVEEHDKRLTCILDRARAINLQLNPTKCRFRVSEVQYVGHLLTDKGVKPDPEKTKAIHQMPVPEDKHALQRFLGMTNYLSKFIYRYSEITSPLRQLLRHDADWCWTEQHAAAVDTLKAHLTSPPVLQYFDVHKPVILSADASQHGLGAVCLQDDKPVAFTSRALTETEARYAQIEKELLALVFACMKFHVYIYGRPVTVETDHQPLITILRKPLHTASARIQRMMLKLQRYHLNVVYKRGRELYVADALSRAHLPTTENPGAVEDYDVLALDEVLSSRRIEELKQRTQADATCQRLADTILNGWPDSFKELPHDIRPFYAMRDELTVDGGLILRGLRYVIPHSLQKYYLTQLHQGHPGVESTKRRARETMFWPTIYSDIDREVSKCAPCNALRQHQMREPLHLHPVPDKPWSITAADVFEWGGKHYLLLVDSYSGWWEFDVLPNLSSTTLITTLKRHFSTHGIPQQLMTDNAPSFSSRDFRAFAHQWDFHHVTSSPHYPRSNGLAERGVRSAKQLLEKCARDGSDIYAALLNLRNTPRNGMPSPAQRLLSRRTRTLIPVVETQLLPHVETDVQAALFRLRTKGKMSHDKSARRLSPLEPGQVVRMETSRGFDKLATVHGKARQPNSYVVHSDGRTYVRNRRHLLPVAESYSSIPASFAPVVPPEPRAEPSATVPNDTPNDERNAPLHNNDDFRQQVADSETPLVVTRSGRTCKPNPKFNDFIAY